MKNKLFLTLILLMLLLPVPTWAVDNINDQEQTIPVEQTINKLDEDSILQDETIYKQPISKKKIAKKFLYAMTGVVISSFLLFLLLTIYNKIRENYLERVRTPDGEISLETPSDLQGAVRTFLDKTNWK